MIHKAGCGIHVVKFLIVTGYFLQLIDRSDSQEMFEQSRAVLNSTSMSFTACAVPVKECPNAERDARNHVSCLRDFRSRSCPEGFYYFCDRHESGYLVEGCFKRNICPKGTANDVEFDPIRRKAWLKCTICIKHTIQPYEHDSFDRFRPGCDHFGVSNDILQDEKMKKVYNGHPTKPDQYICDTSQGYSERKGITLCNVNNDCYCSKQKVCTKEDYQILLPNGNCDRRCAVERDIWKNYSCSQYDVPEKEVESTAVLLKSTSIPVKGVNESEINTTAVPGAQSPGGSAMDWPNIVFPVLAVVVVIGFVVFLLWLFKCRPVHRGPDEEGAANSGVQENSITKIKKFFTNIGTKRIIIEGNNNTIIIEKGSRWTLQAEHMDGDMLI